MVEPAPQRWQCPAERCAAIELVMLPLGSEMRVVAILPSPALVISDCLDMAGRVGAEPAALVGGREAQRIEAADRFVVADPLALPIIAPTLGKARPRYAGRRNVRKGQAFGRERTGCNCRTPSTECDGCDVLGMVPAEIMPEHCLDARNKARPSEPDFGLGHQPTIRL
jgi:hypothetical protein